MASRIEDYGMVGNGRTVALVARSGSVDWWCTPNFDSDACLAGLLGRDEHGRWALRPTGTIRKVEQSYESDSLILCTSFTTDSGVVRIVDFMPLEEDRCELIRVVEGVEGVVPLELLLTPRFAYGADTPLIIESSDGREVTMTAGPDSLRLHGEMALIVDRPNVRAELVARAGERLAFQLAWYPSHRDPPAPLAVAAARERTSAYWTEWASRFPYRGRYREAVLRSLITLKALTFMPSGAIVAAPTTGLPEELGGVRNWDYRYCWIRDASFTLQALMFGGYIEEAAAFRRWLMRATVGEPKRAQIMYDVHGGHRLTEVELAWLPGYEGSRPVRVGNAAADQLQIDVYGELLSTLYVGRRMGLPEISDAWAFGQKIIAHLENIWQHPDDGIWEMRGGRRHFTYSKVMAWVGIDRAVRMIEEFRLGGEAGRAMLPHLRALRGRIHDEVCERGFNRRVGAFVQSYDAEILDASVLLMTHVGFLPADDPRIRGTVAAIERDLVRDGLVLRYQTEHGVDGLAGSEGAFLACSFWLADNYAFAGRTNDAQALFERLLGLRNHLGLLAEEWDPKLERQVGNFPQAFSHLALIATAHFIDPW